MAQFDVFANPIAVVRDAYPFLVALQSDLTSDARNQIVAPLVVRKSLAQLAGRLTPIVVWGGSEYAVMVPALTGMRARDLSKCLGSLAPARNELLAAIDYLFFGV